MMQEAESADVSRANSRSVSRRSSPVRTTVGPDARVSMLALLFSFISVRALQNAVKVAQPTTVVNDRLAAPAGHIAAASAAQPSSRDQL